MNCTKRTAFVQQMGVIQHKLLPLLREEGCSLTPKLEKLTHVLDWLDMPAFFRSRYGTEGRPPHDRQALANAFVAKTVLNLPTTSALQERLCVDRSLRRICGFPLWKKLPSEATFSRAFTEFAESRLAERVHGALIQTHLGGQLVGHVSRDATAIEAREKPVAKPRREPQPAAAPARKCGRPARVGSAHRRQKPAQ